MVIKIADKILVIEDDKDIHTIVGLYLKKHGYEIIFTEYGRDAEKLFYSETFDLILLDLILPDMNGIHLCQKIRQISNIPIIILSGKRDSEDIITGLENGADDYVTKPFDPAVLLARIQVQLRKQENVPPEDSTSVPELTEALNEREKEILTLIVKGFSNKQIAAQLGLTLGTIKVYNNVLYEKIQAKNRIQAILIAKEMGFVD